MAQWARVTGPFESAARLFHSRVTSVDVPPHSVAGGGQEKVEDPSGPKVLQERSYRARPLKVRGYWTRDG